MKGNIPQVARGLVTDGKTKTQINPLERLGLRLGVRLPAGSYKSKLLTPHPKPKPHLLSEGCQPLQGDKQEINPFSSEEVHRFVVYFHKFSMMITAGWGLFPVYRLVLDAKPDRVMPCLTGNH